MKVLLIIPPRISVQDPAGAGEVFPRIGIASIAAYLESKGVEVKVIDSVAEGLTLKDVIKEVSKYDPRVVGVTVYTQEIIDAAKTAAAIKEIDPSIKIVIGGAHASALPVSTLKEFKSFDIAVFGEGEVTFFEVVRTVERGKSLKKLKGIAFRYKDKVILNKCRPSLDMDYLPMPAWHLFPLDKYRGHPITLHHKKSFLDRTLELPIESARGCPFDCIFCYKFVSGIRFRNPKKVVDEIERNLNEFDATKLYFTDGTFGINKKNTIKLCNEIIKRGLHSKISWACGTRADIIDEVLLKKMREAGCTYVGIGVESGVERVLKTIRKGITLNQVRNAFKICNKLGIETGASFIIGHPYETKESILNTIKFARSLDTRIASFPVMVPFPGTKIYDMVQKGDGNYVYIAKNWNDYSTQAGNCIKLVNLPKKQLKRLQVKAYLEFYLSRGRIFYLTKLLFRSSFTLVWQTLKNMLVEENP